MDKMPVEMLENTLQHLLVYHHPVTERFATITPESRRDILNARLVCRAFSESRPLQDAFVKTLEETPLFRKGFRMDPMRNIAVSDYAGKMTMMTLPAFFTRRTDASYSDLTRGIYRLLDWFPKVQHLRLQYTDDVVTEDQDALYPNELTFSNSRRQHTVQLTETHARLRRGHVNILLSLCGRKLNLNTVELPLEGFGASSCLLQLYGYNLWMMAKSLERLSINVAYQMHKAVLDRELISLQNLEWLDIGLSKCAAGDIPLTGNKILVSSRRTGVGLPGRPPRPTLGRASFTTLPKLKTFRFRASFDCFFDAANILEAIDRFPNLQVVGLSHVLLEVGATTWSTLLAEFQRRNLTVQLIYPGYQRDSQGQIRGDGLGESDSLRESAVKGIHVKQFGGEVEVLPIECEASWMQHRLSSGQDTQAPGFAIFDM
ncbi:hypothetical protein PMIN07_000420 [Paraphaeosphaeria minitans]